MGFGLPEYTTRDVRPDPNPRCEFPMGAELPTKGKESTFGDVIYIHMHGFLPITELAKIQIRPHIIRTLINLRLLRGRRSRGSNEEKVPKNTF